MSQENNELRQQLADVSHERDLLRADRDAEKSMKAKAREQRDRFMTRCVELEGLLKNVLDSGDFYTSAIDLNRGTDGMKLWDLICAALSKPAGSEQS